jgi:hypothetical protein
MKRQDDEKLWDLLGHVRARAVSPIFARNVLRTVRNRRTPLVRIGEWFRLPGLIPAATVAMAVVVAVFIARGPQGPVPTTANESDPVAQIDPQDYEVVADLDELIASDENGLWDDNSSL